MKKTEKTVNYSISKYTLLSTADSADIPIIHIRFETVDISYELLDQFKNFIT